MMLHLVRSLETILRVKRVQKFRQQLWIRQVLEVHQAQKTLELPQMMCKNTLKLSSSKVESKTEEILGSQRLIDLIGIQMTKLQIVISSQYMKTKRARMKMPCLLQTQESISLKAICIKIRCQEEFPVQQKAT